MSCKHIHPYTISIEGNIGSGKTTCLNYLKRYYKNIDIVYEPIVKWRNICGYNLLDLLYSDPIKWSFAFQIYVQLTITQNHIKESNYPIKLMERSLHSSRYCFMENIYNSGTITDVEYNVLLNQYNWLIKNVDTKVDKIIYLRNSPEICLNRIRNRNRKEEVKISLDYIKLLHDLHETWLNNGDNIIIDADCDLHEMLNRLDTEVKGINMNFVK